MEGLYEWIRNITYYLIFITVAANLLPDRKYEKYFKLFAGMVLTLLVLKPLTGSLNLDDKLSYYFESISFQKQAKEFSGEIKDMEGQRLLGIISQYEEAVETDLKTMAEVGGLACEGAAVVIDKDKNSKSFGHVVSVRLSVLPEQSQEKGEVDSSGLQIEPVAAVDRITPVEVDAQQASESSLSAPENGTDKESNQTEENIKISGLKRQIAEYYDLEEQDIEIQLEAW